MNTEQKFSLNVSTYNEEVEKKVKNAIMYEIAQITRDGKQIHICVVTADYKLSAKSFYCCSVVLSDGAYVLVGEEALKLETPQLRYVIEHNIGHIVLGHNELFAQKYNSSPDDYYLNRTKFDGEDIRSTELQADIYAAKRTDICYVVGGLKALAELGIISGSEAKERTEKIRDDSVLVYPECMSSQTEALLAKDLQVSKTYTTFSKNHTLYTINVVDLPKEISDNIYVDGWNRTAFIGSRNFNDHVIYLFLTTQFYNYPPLTKNFIIDYLIMGYVESGCLDTEYDDINNNILEGRTKQYQEMRRHQVLLKWKPEEAVQALMHIGYVNNFFTYDLTTEIEYFKNAEQLPTLKVGEKSIYSKNTVQHDEPAVYIMDACSNPNLYLDGKDWYSPVTEDQDTSKDDSEDDDPWM